MIEHSQMDTQYVDAGTPGLCYDVSTPGLHWLTVHLI